MALYIGLMSGTSLDGIDGVLADLDADAGARPIRVLAHRHHPFPDALRATLLALNDSGADELHRAAQAAHGLARAYAGVVERLLNEVAIAPRQVRALGAHGQTVRHRPRAPEGGYTIQLMNGALLAERTGIDVVCDFRSRDIAAGGEGAPLVPAFHAAVFGNAALPVAVLNLGGISNVTLLRGDGGVAGHDCGPGNALLDLWVQRHRGTAYDADGAWAARGRADETLLARLLAEPFFAQAPPKSTGRDLFNAAWLQQHLDRLDSLPAPVDVQATLAELTVRSSVQEIRRHAPDVSRLLLCGGGAFSADLRRRFAAALPAVDVTTTADAGVPPDQVEALAFAWLAMRHVERQPGNLPSVTGAAGPRVLGALHPAG